MFVMTGVKGQQFTPFSKCPFIERLKRVLSSASGFHSSISGCERKLQLWTLSVDKNFREKAMRSTENYSVVGSSPNGPSLQVLDLLVHDWG